MLPPACVECSFSSDYSSVHGESPSAEYARLRKESLESQFGRMLGSKSVSVFYRFGPFLALYRAAIISFYVLKLTVWRFFVHDMDKRSVKVSSDMSKISVNWISWRVFGQSNVSSIILGRDMVHGFDHFSH